MEFVVLLLSVLAITLTLVIARPTDTEDNTKNGKNTGYEEFKFMLPVAAYNLRDKYEIEINGTLDLTQENFAVTLLNGVEESEACKLNFNYEENSRLLISSKFENYTESVDYGMADIQNKKLNPEFRLSLRAMENFDNKLFIISLDNSGVVTCKVNSLDSLSYIVFKEGVKKVHSIKFTF